MTETHEPRPTGDEESVAAPPPFDIADIATSWHDGYEAVPRAAFLPDVMWPHDMATGRTTAVDRAEAPDAWRTYARSNAPIVTQWDDGAHEGPTPGRVFSSSSSMPSLVLGMLDDLDVRPGHRALEIGSGTGWNAGLLAHRIGPRNVVTIEVDEAVAAAAQARLRRAGLGVRVVHGDGLVGWPQGAPYDRIVATCGLRSVPFAWVEQTAPGGVILVPWGTYYSFTEATARLVVAGDGLSASGPFTRPVTFMRARTQRLRWPGHSAYVTANGSASAAKSSTTVAQGPFFGGHFDAAAFAIGLRVPQCTHVVDRPHEDGSRPVWFYGLTDRSWAVVVFREGQPESRVVQSGPRRLWDEVEAAHRWWVERGKPDFPRFGLTVTAEGERAWLEDPDADWPL